MTTLDDFSERNSTESTDRFDRSKKPHVERRFGVRDPDDRSTLFGMIGYDHVRDCYVYSSPRHRSRNYYRKIGGYPISTDILDRLAAPDAGASYDPVKVVYIIQRESTDDHPAKTVFEYDLRTYREAALLNYPGFGEQRCPTLDPSDEYGPAAVWEGYGDAIFETGQL